MSTLFLLKGISGCGKGSRVSQLIEFLKTEYKYHTYLVDKLKVGEEKFNLKKPLQLGIIFPDLNTFFVGRWVQSNKSKLISWSSLDNLSRYGQTFYRYLPIKFSKMNLVVEGYFGGKTNAFIPKFAKKYFDKGNFVNYYYEDIEELQERVVGRSGKRIKGTCYRDNSKYTKPEVRLNEINAFVSEWPELTYEFKNYKDPLVNFGITFIHELELGDDLKQKFLDYSKHTTTLREVDMIQDPKYHKYWVDGDSENSEIHQFDIDSSIDKEFGIDLSIVKEM